MSSASVNRCDTKAIRRYHGRRLHAHVVSRRHCGGCTIRGDLTLVWCARARARCDCRLLWRGRGDPDGDNCETERPFDSIDTERERERERDAFSHEA